MKQRATNLLLACIAAVLFAGSAFAELPPQGNDPRLNEQHRCYMQCQSTTRQARMDQCDAKHPIADNSQENIDRINKAILAAYLKCLGGPASCFRAQLKLYLDLIGEEINWDNIDANRDCKKPIHEEYHRCFDACNRNSRPGAASPARFTPVNDPGANPTVNGRTRISDQTPLVIAMPGHDFVFTSIADGVAFDLDANGTPDRTSWTAAGTDVRFLAADWNGNGLIDSGLELFGEESDFLSTEDWNGFAALGVHDSPWLGGNGDTWIDEQDAVWPRLTLWRDQNHDGISQNSELQHPLLAGIRRISYDFERSGTMDAHGNIFSKSARVDFGSHIAWSVIDIVFLLQGDEGVPLLFNFHPKAGMDFAVANPGQMVEAAVLVNDVDPEGGAVTLAGVRTPYVGTASILNGKVRYTPPAGFVGTVDVTYQVRDNFNLLSDGTFRVLVRGERVFTFGVFSDKPVVGDWNGDGLAEIAMYRPAEQKFYLENGTVVQFRSYNSWDLPIAGDWNGDGRDEVGLYRDTTGQFFLCDLNQAAFPGRVITLGAANSRPVTGDWNGDGREEIGVFEPATRTWRLQGVDPFVYGDSADQPIAGDWNGDGRDDPGIFRNGTYLLRTPSAVTAGAYEWRTQTYGQAGDRPIAGDWLKIGRATVGFARGNEIHQYTATPVW